MKARLLFVVSAISLFVVSTSHATPVQWEVASGGNGHFYEAILVPGTGAPFVAPITWTEANAAAEALGNGWHLATIGSAEENAFVFSLVSGIPEFWFEHGGPPIGNSIGPWLGASSPTTSSNDFEWVTGEPFAYTNWASPSPSANGDGLHFFGRLLATTPAPTWNDYVNTFGTKGYIIERAAAVVGTIPEPITATLGLMGLGVLGMATRRRAA